MLEKIEVNEGILILRRLCWEQSFLEKCPFIKAWMFETPEMRKAAEWVLEYFDISKKTIKGRLPELLIRFSKNRIPNVDFDILKKLIDNLTKPETESGEYEIRCALEWSKFRALEKTQKEFSRALEAKDCDSACSMLANFKPVVRFSGQGIELSKDFGKAVEGFNSQEHVLFRLPGAVGDMLGSIIASDFIGIVAPMKRGKSWWLIYFAVQAALRGKRTLYINLEMRDSDICRRVWQALLGIPKHYGRVRYKMPSYDRNYGYQMQEVEREFPEVTEGYLRNELARLQSSSKFAGIRIESRPTNTFTVSQLEEFIALLEKEDGCIPEVIVVDYADLLRSEYRGTEERHRLNSIWADLRRLSLQLDCAIITASQSGRSTLKGDRDVSGSDVSEDSRKIAHVTKMMTLNQSKEEKADGIMRVESEIQRDGAATYGQVVCLQALDIGQVCVDSIPIKDFRRV
jgi:KaiC/GvpD/RAD55 family RecA-like ATPase